ncbi:MAG: hypothetical protein WB626_11730 [Bacteroidota bacterium]
MDQVPAHADSLSPLLIPIVVGVTGHRDLREEDLPHLRDSVSAIFRDLRGRYPRSPLILLSPLAEGADQLVAEVALAGGAGLVVPIPMPLEAYLRGFDAPAARNRFRELFAKAAGSIQTTPGEAAAATGAASEANGRYAAMGAFLARTSPILIALWDGDPHDPEGGTSHVVQFKLGEKEIAGPRPPSFLIQEESGPVFQVVTPRRDRPSPPPDAFQRKTLFPKYWGAERDAERVFRRSLSNIERYNGDAPSAARGAGKGWEASTRLILGEELAGSLDQECGITLRRYLLADELAARFKRARVFSLSLVLALAVGAFFSFHLYLEFYRHIPPLILVYPGLLGLAGLWYLHARARGYEYRHEDYRALAEAMRVQLFWNIAGVRAQASDHYLHKHKGELEWIRFALRGWNSLHSPAPCGASGREADERRRLEALSGAWLDAQAAWFRKRGLMNERVHLVLKWGGNGLLILGAVLAVSLFSLEIMGTGQWFRHHAPMAVVASLVFAGSIHWFLEKLAFQEQTKQYARMAVLYADASARIRKLLGAGDIPAARGLLFEVGREALAEGADWLLLHRARPINIPAP